MLLICFSYLQRRPRDADDEIAGTLGVNEILSYAGRKNEKSTWLPIVCVCMDIDIQTYRYIYTYVHMYIRSEGVV